MIAFFDSMLKGRKGYGRAMEPLCREWELTRNELDVMLFLFNNPGLDRAADIVARRGIAKSHVSLAVSSLEERGLLARLTDPEDRRTVHLKLTEQAVPLAERAREIQREYFSRLFAGVSREEMEAWQAIIVKICKNIDELEEN